MVLMGVYEITNDTWWIRKSEIDPPDGMAITYKIQKESNNVVEEDVPIPVEVLFAPKYIRKQKWDTNLTDEENIFNFIFEKKIKRKFYATGARLIIYFDIKLRNFSLENLKIFSGFISLLVARE